MSFKDYFPFDSFLAVMAWDKFNPRPNTGWNTPESDAWYAASSDHWHRVVTGRLLSFVQSLSSTRPLRDIANHSDREYSVHGSWQKIMDGSITGEHNHMFTGIEGMLRQSIVSVSYTPGIDAITAYRKLVEVMDSGTYPWYMMSISCRCDRTGQTLMLDMVDWVPSWGLSHNNQFTIMENLPPETGYREVEIELKTGNLLCDDWFRIKGFTELFEDDYQIGYTHGKVSRTLDYLTKDFILVCAGNCTVYAYSPSETDTSTVIFNYGDGMSYNEETDEEEMVDTRGHDLGAISCSHWAVGVIEYETLIEKLTPKHGAETQRIVDEYMATTSEGCRITVEPGRYRLMFRARGDMLPVMAERGIDNLGCDAPLFVLTKLD